MLIPDLQVSHSGQIPSSIYSPRLWVWMGRQLYGDCAQSAIEVGKSNVTRTSHFAKNVSTLVVLATATSPTSEISPVNPATALMLAASSQTLVHNPTGPPPSRSLRISIFSIVTSQPKPCST